jgi:hypothetical protein
MAMEAKVQRSTAVELSFWAMNLDRWITFFERGKSEIANPAK